MWNLPGSGIEPMSPASAGGFFTTEPRWKPSTVIFKDSILLSTGVQKLYPRAFSHPMQWSCLSPGIGMCMCVCVKHNLAPLKPLWEFYQVCLKYLLTMCHKCSISDFMHTFLVSIYIPLLFPEQMNSIDLLPIFCELQVYTFKCSKLYLKSQYL